jgi:hypothetical protein
MCSTRRPNASGITLGNNNFGRVGRPRCLQCRTWRQKVHLFALKILMFQCDYTSPELACKLCVKKGFACGPKLGGQNRRVLVINGGDNQRETAEQAFGDQMAIHEVDEIIRQPLYPEEEVPDPMDSICLEYFFTNMKFHLWMDCGVWNSLSVQDFLKKRLEVNLSKPVKFAIILSTALCAPGTERLEPDSMQTSRRLDLFYRYAREAISRELYIDLVIGCYYFIFYCFFEARPVDEIAHHTTGFLLSLRNLINSQTLSSAEMFLTQCMWCEILRFMCYCNFTMAQNNDVTRASNLKTLLPVIRSTSSLFPARTTCRCRYIYCSEHDVPLTVLLHELSFYVRYYFAHKNDLELSASQKA